VSPIRCAYYLCNMNRDGIAQHDSTTRCAIMVRVRGKERIRAIVKTSNNSQVVTNSLDWKPVLVLCMKKESDTFVRR
jgi:hypothetical protein